jgi:hypothetical protein
MADNVSEANEGIRHNRRGMTPAVAAAVLIVVVLVVGAAGYAALNSTSGSSSQTTSTCSPASICAPSTTSNDVRLYTAYTPGYGQTLATVASGSPLPVTLTLTGGEAANSYTVAWGDGNSTTQATGAFSHAYYGEGTYVVTPTALVGSTVHTGSTSYFPISVTQSLTNLTLGYYPSLKTTFTNSTGGIYPWIAAGGTVTVSANYTVNPSATGWLPGAPSLTTPSGASQSGLVTSSDGAKATYTFSNPGTYLITFIGPTANATKTLYQDYTWTVIVLPANSLAPSCSLCTAPVAKSPHPGVLDVVEVGGPPIGGVDPSYDYDTVGDEPILNVFETLVNYNGSAVGYNAQSYVPALATCVPTSAACTTEYGNDLVANNGSFPEYWTFVIDSKASLYDPATGKSEPVYPADVMFSVARALAYADLPGSGYYNGWILAQSLLQPGNPAWDGGIHYPYNNTASNVLGSMIVNDSAYCPHGSDPSGFAGNGCITFNAWGGGAAWPNFLQLITDPLGGSVEECSYYVALAASLPGFSAASADTPCALPDGGTSTNNTQWTNYLAGLSPTAWDAAEIAGGANYPHATPQTETVAAGSGPYYLASANFGIGYTMHVNPGYQQPSGCVGQAWCLPAVGAYANTVNVQWMLTDSQAIADYQAGFADFAGIYTSHTSTLLDLQQKGLIGVTQAPTTDIGFMMPNLEINVPGLKAIDPYSTNVQPNTFAYNGLRDFFAASFPYATVQNTLNTVDGLQFFSTFAGYFPQYLGNIYPNGNTAVLSQFPNYNTTTNTFQDPPTSSNAASIVHSAQWWWAQVTDPSSPLYDPQFGSGAGQYDAAHPLVLPLIGEIGATALDSTFKIWIPLIASLSGGAIEPDTFDLSFSELGANIGSPGTTSLDFWVLAWAADYASPWDFAIPSVLPDGTYSGPNAYYETLSEQKYGGDYNDPSCGNGGTSEANLTYWATLQFIPTDCQGVAYNVTVGMIKVANANPNQAAATLEYQQTDAVFCLLGLTVPDGQTNAVVTYAPWINPTSIDLNLIFSGGGADEVWYGITGNGVAG